MTTELEATAYHEAGHVAAVLHAGLKFRYVTIRPKGKELAGQVVGARWGRIPEPGSADARTEQRLRYAIIDSLAGPEAEKRFTGVYNVVGADADLNRVGQCLHGICLGAQESELWMNLLRFQMDRMLDQDWEYVEAIARALLRERTLSYVQVLDAILRS